MKYLIKYTDTAASMSWKLIVACALLYTLNILSGHVLANGLAFPSVKLMILVFVSFFMWAFIYTTAVPLVYTLADYINPNKSEPLWLKLGQLRATLLPALICNLAIMGLSMWWFS